MEGIEFDSEWIEKLKTIDTSSSDDVRQVSPLLSPLHHSGLILDPLSNCTTEIRTTTKVDDDVRIVSPLLSPLHHPDVVSDPLSNRMTERTMTTTDIKVLDYLPRCLSRGEPFMICLSSSNLKNVSVWFDDEKVRAEVTRITPHTWRCVLPRDIEATMASSRVITMRVHFATVQKNRHGFTNRHNMTVRFDDVSKKKKKNILSRKRSRQDVKEAEEEDSLSSKTEDIIQNERTTVSPINLLKKYRKSFPVTVEDEEDVEIDTNELSAKADRDIEEAFRVFKHATKERHEQRNLFVNEAERVDESGLNLLHFMCLYVIFSLPCWYTHTYIHTHTNRYGKVEVVSRLLAIGVDPNIRTRNQVQESALHIAASRNYGDIALILCDRGADLTMLDANRMTPSDRAKNKGHEFLAKMLKEASENTSKSFKTTSLAERTLIVATKSKEDIQENIIKQCISQDLSLHERCAMYRSGSFDVTSPSSLSSTSPPHHHQTSTPFFQNRTTTPVNNNNKDDDDDVENDPVASIARALERMSASDKAKEKASVASAIEMMSESERKSVEQNAAIIRRSARGWLLRRHYIKLREATALVQKSLRRKLKRREQNRKEKKEAVKKIERWVRSVKAAVVLQKQVQRRSQAASTIQKWTRRQQRQKRRRRE